MIRAAIPLSLVTAAVALPAATAPAGDHGSSTFEGTCDFAGVLRQDPPLTNAPAHGEARARAKGPCSGTWTDARGRVHELDGDAVTYVARAEGTVSCEGGSATGSGFLRYRRDRLEFDFSEVRGPGAAAISLQGEDGGGAGGAAAVSEDEDPAEIAEKCGGEGVRQVGIRIHLASPGISG
jgi:hypothetical protein